MKRSEVNIKQTWDLTQLYKTEKDYENAVEEFKTKVENFVENYKGKINSLEVLNSLIKDLAEIHGHSSKMGSYAYLDVETDAMNEEANIRLGKLYNVFAKYNSKLSFCTNEILELDDEILKEAKNIEFNKVFIENLLAVKKYRLETSTEEALSALSNTLSFPYSLYNTTKLKDIAFPEFEANGKKHSLSYNLYEDGLDGSDNTEIRRNSFKTFAKTLRKYQHTTAATYNAQVQKEKSLSDLRGHKSVFDYLLLNQKVDRSLYNRQIDLIMSELAPHMRKYANILKRLNKLDEIKYSDLKMDVDPNYSPSVTYDEAKNYILEGLEVLGEDYNSIMKKAFDNRWIDYANNEGKSTGAFCSSPYGANGYILMTFNNSMSDVLTLAHELGHAGHFQYAQKFQSPLSSECSLYFVEAPSTTNELIVENYLLKMADEKKDLRMKRWVLSAIISKTYYHNFVTHLLEADYQRKVYELVDSGNEVYASTLNKLYKETLENFWGDAVELEEGCELTWMRQPHYYMGLYSYTYSAGLTIGTQIARDIVENGEESAKNWIEVLKMGGSKSPLELAKSAGVDVSTDKPLKDTIKYIGSIIDEIEEISKELGEL